MPHSQYYTTKAQEMRELAKMATSASTRDEFLRLAHEYEKLAVIAGEAEEPRRTA